MRGKPFKEGKYLNGWGMAFVAIQLCKKDPKKIRKMYKVKNGTLRQKITKARADKWNQLWKELKPIDINKK